MTLAYIPAVRPADELERLNVLRAYDILDTPQEPEFDRIVTLAAGMFGVPLVALSLVDADRQWFKASVGLDVKETARDVAFCAHTILGDGICLVSDAAADPRFRGNPLVTGSPAIRFYAGSPLLTRDGHRIGTLCVMDTHPRADFSSDQQRYLSSLAALAMDELELRSTNAALLRQAAAMRETHLKLERAGRAQAEFFGAMQQKLHAPLDAIHGLVELVGTDALQPASRERLELLRGSVDRLRRTIDALLNVSQIDADRMELQRADFDLAELVSSATTWWESEAHAKGLTLTCRVDSSVPRATRADGSAIRQVLDQLIQNAIKFTDRGSVRVRVSCRGISDKISQVRFEVLDSGRGLDRTMQADPFAAITMRSAWHNRWLSGVGTGLVLCQRLVELMRGEIGVQPVPGGGSNFWFELPLEAPPCMSAATPAAAAQDS